MKRYELVLVLIVFLAGMALRLSSPQLMGIEHFDEGVYASVLWHDGNTGVPYPSRHLYAPPLLSELIAWSSLLTGGAEWAPFLPALVLGCCTIPLVWYMARRMFGGVAGLFAAIIVALSDFHIQYSRMALTDVPALFFILAAIGLGLEGIERRSPRIMAVAGFVTGIAWWTKYTGWLPLAVVAAGSAIWWIRSGRRSLRLRGLLGLVGMMVAVAGLTFFPWWLSLQTAGGYSAISANHAGFLQGFDVWVRHLAIQLVCQLRIDGLSGAVSVGFGILAAGFARWLKLRSFTWNRSDVHLDSFPPNRVAIRFLLAGLSIGFIGLSIPSPLLLTCLSIGGISGVVMWRVLQRLYDRRLRQDLSPVEGWEVPLFAEDLNWAPRIDPDLTAATVGVWFVALLTVTPLYHPYVRLMFPLVSATWMASAAGIGWWIESNLSVARRGAMYFRQLTWVDRAGQIAVSALTGAIILTALNSGVGVPPAGHEDRTSLSRAALEVTKLCDSDEGTKDIPAIVYAFGEPALLYHLNRAGTIGVPVADLGAKPAVLKGQPIPSFLVFGPNAKMSPGFWDQLLREEQRLRHVADVEFQPSTAVLFDLYTPQYLRDHPELFTQKLEVYRILR